MMYFCFIQDWQFDPEKKKKCEEFYPRGYMGVCKLGRPIYIEKVGVVKPEKVWEVID